jgi:serine/threonine protein kinase
VRATSTPTLQLDGRTAPSTAARTVRRGAIAAGDPPSPIILDRYRLKKRLGSGSFGTVWSAHDERLERDVAVKILPRDRVVQARFEREARAAARLQHPAIVTLYEAAVDDDGAYLVSELVKGPTLDALLSAGKLSDRDVLEIAIGLCDALTHAHQQGVIHRDVKPANVLIASTATAVNHPVKLTDFGIAKVSGDNTLTRTGDVIGTLAYMAPEQALGKEAGPAADLYSLALITYEALTGVNPVTRNGARKRNRRPATYLPPLRRQRHDLPRDLAAAIDTALRPRTTERGTIEELRCALDDCLERVGDQPGVIEPARAATLIHSRGHDYDDEFDATWRNDQQPEPRRRKDKAPVRSDRGLITWLRQHMGWRSATLLSGVTLLGLGAVGAAGAWPGLAAVTLRTWWQRLIAGALGFAWLGIATQITHRSMYWRINDGHLQWIAVAAGVWAVATVVGGWIRRLPNIGMVLIAASGWAAAAPAAVIAAGVHPLAGEVLGAVLGAAIVAAAALFAAFRGAGA